MPIKKNAKHQPSIRTIQQQPVERISQEESAAEIKQILAILVSDEQSERVLSKLDTALQARVMNESDFTNELISDLECQRLFKESAITIMCWVVFHVIKTSDKTKYSLKGSKEFLRRATCTWLKRNLKLLAIYMLPLEQLLEPLSEKRRKCLVSVLSSSRELPSSCYDFELLAAKVKCTHFGDDTLSFRDVKNFVQQEMLAETKNFRALLNKRIERGSLDSLDELKCLGVDTSSGRFKMSWMNKEGASVVLGHGEYDDDSSIIFVFRTLGIPFVLLHVDETLDGAPPSVWFFGSDREYVRITNDFFAQSNKTFALFTKILLNAFKGKSKYVCQGALADYEDDSERFKIIRKNLKKFSWGDGVQIDNTQRVSKKDGATSLPEYAVVIPYSIVTIEGPRRGSK